METTYEPPKKGLHQSLFAFACRCAEWGMPPEVARKCIVAGLAARPAHREPDDREIDAAIEDAYRLVLGGESNPPPKRLPQFDSTAAREIFRKRQLSQSDLMSASPCEVPDKPQEVLVALYSPQDLLCLSPDTERAKVRTAGQWIAFSGLDGIQFMVPHPMTALTGITKDGREGRPRTAMNTGERRWIVCDFDLPPPEWQPSIIAYLAEFSSTQPTLVVHSGNKSLHAWFPTDGLTPEAVCLFEEEAATLGADPALLGEGRRCQLVRLPNGMRSDGRKQQLLYWNPGTLNAGYKGGAA